MCRGYFSSQEIDSHHAPNTDRPINRAMVVGCAVSATRNHLKLHEPRTLKILLCNVHAKTRKLCKHSARAPRPPSRSPPTYDPHSTRCTAGCHTPATSCIGAFRTPVAAARDSLVMPASENL